MGKERKTNEEAPEKAEDLPRWQEIREQRLRLAQLLDRKGKVLEHKLDGKEHLDLTISEYLRLLEFGKNLEEDSSNRAPKETNGECHPNRRKKKS